MVQRIELVLALYLLHLPLAPYLTWPEQVQVPPSSAHFFSPPPLMNWPLPHVGCAVHLVSRCDVDIA